MTFDIATLRRAVDLYMDKAYEGREPPAAVQRRLDWGAANDLATLLAGPPFEQARAENADSEAIHALRLGNPRYPHMKLQVQRWPNSDGYLLSVNTHDQVLGISPNARDLEAFRALQAENQRLKEAIEEAWEQAGLPTFLQYLRDFISRQNEEGQASS